MSEWPLIVFTLAIQFAGGLALAVSLCDRPVQAPEFVRPAGLAIFPLALLGLVASLWHLGRPLSAWKSLMNLGSSRLSVEVLLTLLFAAAALLYSYFWLAQKTEYRFTLGIMTSLTAVAAIASSAAIYLVPSQPAWNSFWVPLSFFGTALLLGGSAPAVFGSWQSARNLHSYLIGGTVLGSLLLIAAAIWMIANLSQGPADAFAAAQLKGAFVLLTSRYPLWLGLHLLFAGIIPLASAALLWWGKHTTSTPPWPHLLLFLTVSAGTVIGRWLMYRLVASQPQF